MVLHCITYSGKCHSSIKNEWLHTLKVHSLHSQSCPLVNSLFHCVSARQTVSELVDTCRYPTLRVYTSRYPTLLDTYRCPTLPTWIPGIPVRIGALSCQCIPVGSLCYQWISDTYALFSAAVNSNSVEAPPVLVLYRCIFWRVLDIVCMSCYMNFSSMYL